MTDTVVAQGLNTVVTTNQTTTTIISEDSSPTIIVTGMMGPAGAASGLNSLPDIDISNLSNGSLFVYNSTTNKWVATTLLSQQSFEGGQY